jgi:hypothetical protein
MLPPDHRLFEEDLLSAPYRMGAVKGVWGLAEAGAAPEGAAWPNAYFWMAAAPRTNAPDRFCVALDLTGYRSASPTGAFWDPEKKAPLDFAKWPKGKSGSRFAMVFRTTGFNGCGQAFYHPYDRVARVGHHEWPRQQPHLIWSDTHTIVHYLEEFQSLLTTGDYVGV